MLDTVRFYSLMKVATILSDNSRKFLTVAFAFCDDTNIPGYCQSFRN